MYISLKDEIVRDILLNIKALYETNDLDEKMHILDILEFDIEMLDDMIKRNNE